MTDQNHSFNSIIEFDTLTYTKVEIENDLLEVYEEEGFTYLHCTYKASPRWEEGWWVNIYSSTFLITSDTELKLIHAINVPISPARHYLKHKEDYLNFTLIFPALPKNCIIFDLYEKNEQGFGLSVKNIPRNNTDVYRINFII